MGFKNILKSKTIWTGITGVAAAASGYFTGEIEAGIALQTIMTCLIGVFLRTGIAKGM